MNLTIRQREALRWATLPVKQRTPENRPATGTLKALEKRELRPPGPRTVAGVPGP